jgi:hypothetical protein
MWIFEKATLIFVRTVVWWVKTLNLHLGHRVGRVLSFSPVVGIRTPPTPHPQASGQAPLVLGGGAHSLAREGVGESQLRRGDIRLQGDRRSYSYCVGISSEKDPDWQDLLYFARWVFIEHTNHWLYNTVANFFIRYRTAHNSRNVRTLYFFQDRKESFRLRMGRCTEYQRFLFWFFCIVETQVVGAMRLYLTALTTRLTLIWFGDFPHALLFADFLRLFLID